MQKPRKIGGFEGIMPSCRFSAGFRQVPRGSAAVHCANWPFSSLLYSTRPIPGVSKPTKRWLLGKGWGRRKREDRKGISDEKGGFEGVMPTSWCSVWFRQVPWVPASFRGGTLRLSSLGPWFLGAPPSAAAAHCAHWPFSSLLYPTHQTIQGVSQPPKRWVLGKGGGRAKTRRAKVGKHRQKVGFSGVIPPMGGFLGFRCCP